MKKIMILFGIIILSNYGTKAQQLVSTAGNYFENEQVSISWSLGETVIETYTAGELTLTQGFQQPALSVSTLVENPDNDFQLIAFPNPTRGHVTISTDFLHAENLNYLIYDLQGRILSNKTLDGPHTGIAFDDFHPGTYFIRISNKEIVLKVFKIIKN
jgi:hypothetical protein